MPLEEEILALVKKADPDNPTEYVRNIVKEYAREKLDNYILACQDCPIHNSTKTLTCGPANASVLVISDYVLPDQDQRGGATYPFVGTKAYEILCKTLVFYGLNINEFFFMNAVNCCPTREIADQENRFRIPTLDEKQHCRIFLDYAIKMLDPVFMIILGNISLNNFIRDTVFNVHGKLLNINGIPAIATYNPDYLLWSQEKTPAAYPYEKEIFLHDFEMIKEHLLRYKDTNLFL